MRCSAGVRGRKKKAGAVRALSLCTARLEIMELTIIIIIITTVDSPVLNHVRGQNFSCCSYSTLSLTYILYLPTFDVEFDDDLLPPSPPTQSKDLCYLPYWLQWWGILISLFIHSFIHSFTEELT